MTTARMQQRRDTAANWTAENPVLAAGEIGYETDTGSLKIGDGATTWNALDAFSPPAAPVVSQIVYDTDDEITFPAMINTAIIQGAASAMTLAAPANPADNGRRLRVLKDKAGEITITSDTDAIQSGDGGGALISGNTFTIKDDTARVPVEFEANDGRWIVDGFPQFYGYGFTSTV